MLGWYFCYALRDRELILGNNPQFMNSVLGIRGQGLTSRIQSGSSLDDLTVIRLDQRKQAFDDIMGKLDAESIKARQQTPHKSNEGADGSSAEFFSGSLSSLLDVAAAIRQIEIRRSSSSDH